MNEVYILAILISPLQCHGTAVQCCQSEGQHPGTHVGELPGKNGQNIN